MSRDWAEIASEEVAMVEVAPAVYPIIRHAGSDDIIAFQGRRPIAVQEFRQHVTALAARLPARDYVLNLCVDRYKFVVGLVAALSRRQITLLPPNDLPAVLTSLTADYPDLYCIAEISNLPIPGMIYPDDLDGAATERDITAIAVDQPAVALFTSGSTGRPRPAVKSWGTLVRSALAAGRGLGIDAFPAATIIGTVPHQHSYGFESTVMLALQHGLTIDTGRPFYPDDVRASIAAVPEPRILITTPVHIRALLAEPEAMPPVNLVVSATAPLQASIAARAEARFCAPLLEIYGCTEAGQIAVRRTAQQNEWRRLDGVVLRHGPDATWVGGSSVGTEVLLQDSIEPTGSETFLLRGRLADLVDVAGKHTSLAYLNHQLLSIDGIEDGTFLMPDDAAGGRITRPMAFVVAPGLQAEAVQQALRARIDAAFLPRPLVFVEKLPRNAIGKLPRDALLRLAARIRSG